jgi:hypothetical protein
MSVRRPVSTQIAAILLAVHGWASSQPAAAIDGLLPENTLRASWSPSRDEAVVVESISSESSEPTIAAGESVLSHSLLARRPASLSRPAPARLRASYSQNPTPAEALPAPAPASPQGLPVPSVMHSQGGESFIHEGLQGGGACCDPCMPNCCGQWNNCGPVSPCCLLPPLAWDNFEIFGGVQGFTGPLNRGGSGSFGFHEGFNWGIPVCGCVAWQWGVNWTQNNLDGSFVSADDRNQIFLTAGFYRRVDWGLQGGLVVDYLHEECDYEIDLVQLRGELSWLFCGTEDIGVWFTAGVNDEEPFPLRRATFGTTGAAFTTTTTGVEVNDMFAFFYRRQLACGGNARVFGGFTGSDQGLVGAEILLPINPCLSLRSNFLYVVPNHRDSSESSDFLEETWNVGISLVWTRCPRSLCSSNYSRPLFTVADNGSFITRFPHQD